MYTWAPQPLIIPCYNPCSPGSPRKVFRAFLSIKVPELQALLLFSLQTVFKSMSSLSCTTLVQQAVVLSSNIHTSDWTRSVQNCFKYFQTLTPTTHSMQVSSNVTEQNLVSLWFNFINLSLQISGMIKVFFLNHQEDIFLLNSKLIVTETFHFKHLSASHDCAPVLHICLTVYLTNNGLN